MLSIITGNFHSRRLSHDFIQPIVGLKRVINVLAAWMISSLYFCSCVRRYALPTLLYNLKPISCVPPSVFSPSIPVTKGPDCSSQNLSPVYSYKNKRFPAKKPLHQSFDDTSTNLPFLSSGRGDN